MAGVHIPRVETGVETSGTAAYRNRLSDGGGVQAGFLFFDTEALSMWVYDGSDWFLVSPQPMESLAE